MNDKSYVLMLKNVTFVIIIWLVIPILLCVAMIPYICTEFPIWSIIVFPICWIVFIGGAIALTVCNIISINANGVTLFVYCKKHRKQILWNDIEKVEADQMHGRSGATYMIELYTVDRIVSIWQFKKGVEQLLKFCKDHTQFTNMLVAELRKLY